MLRGRPRRISGRGLWRAGGVVGAVLYSIVMWGALIYGTPRVVAWLGERTAMASQAPTTEPSRNPSGAPKHSPGVEKP